MSVETLTLKMIIAKIIFGFALFSVSLRLSEGAFFNSSGPVLEINEEADIETFDPKNPRLYHLGSIDGKSFFAHNLTNGVSWDAAKSYCTSAGMKIAKIATVSQQDLLKNKYDATNFNGCFWTRGRDARNANQFVWDTDNTSPTSGLIFGDFSPELTCLHYISIQSSISLHGKLFSTRCSSLACTEYGVGVICET